MKDWTPRRISFDPSLTLSRNEIFVLSRVDGTLSVSDLADLTGLDMGEVTKILGNLVQQGAVEAELGDDDDDDGGRISWIADQLPGSDGDPSTQNGDLATRSPPLESRILDGSASEPELAAVAFRTPKNATLEEIAEDLLVEASAAAEELTAEEPEPDLRTESAEHESGGAEEGGDERSYRELYEKELHPLPLAQRITLARMCEGKKLMALCFDGDPQVIRAVLENDRVNTGHARLIAFHHRNPVGLDHVAARVEFLRDTQVQRRLLRNTQLTEVLLKRLLMPKRLLEIYKASNDRDIPDRTRNSAKALFKTKYGQSQPEEKFELIWSTEGRVLPFLLGQTIDQKTAAMICARNVASVMLIQSFARFPATPPSVLTHLLRQPLVKRQAHLRNMILQHPNVPGEAKRKG